MLNDFLDIHPEVRAALDNNQPVVALESTIISHGMPYPQNVETALKVSNTVRESGATPATIAIINGRLKVGLTPEEIELLGKAGQSVAKVSRRDIPFIVAAGKHGATTVAATMILADMAGVRVFATGGIGGVHRGAETTFDVSADLQELAQTNVAVVCAGAKSILDLGLTLEYLETHGVPVIGYQTESLPAFYTQSSDFKVDYRLDSAIDIASVLKAKQKLELKGGAVITNPIPTEFAMPKDVIDSAIEQALREADEQGIHGKASTPFLLARVCELTGGDSLSSNIQLVLNNARLASAIAIAYCA
ncbi:pseudouridine-5'-phosphate glycosidase [Vibrio diazotrophicus]|uniref:Pseudouridine-5'-phosphate glycosidase n=1 Tax=Vibrio diazotrophicus TaxID=685 RepID=A0A329E6B3_VIBDI|nr:pseudouridine-5'-phosphate glycosidase [Vibrio diazotrophicus]PNH91762.1 pseudouridine-5-phosphate glycosidase [Vibrio diazotrophicus]RAS60990.1 pseudouridine-5'-phosphate glycosidase [Vibrio diazotrophicus]